jgi:hypothetical protein
VRRGALLLALAILLGAAGCYRPSLKDGGLACSKTSLLCPEGYSCIDGHCYRGDAAVDRTPDAPSDRMGGGGADGATTDGAPDGDANACQPRQAPAGCTPQAGLVCDPVCQTGCCTNQKCTAVNRGDGDSSTAALDCARGSWLRDVGETCDVANAGTELRNDNCLPGMLCVAGDAEKICMKLCRNDGDCTGGARCESRQIERSGKYLASVCGLPTAACNPADLVATTGCPAGLTCYLLRTSTGDRTVCDISSGDGGNGMSCTFPYDCLPGWTCPQVGPGAGRCQPVCSHDGTAPAGCPIGLTCQTTGTTYDLCL